MPDSHPSERTIFLSAIEKRTPAERASYVAEACGHDAPLRAAVEELLAAHDRLGGAEPPALTGGPFAGEGPGTVIGPYRLLEQIGEGGFAVVFLAEQTQPVRRQVALKVLKPGMDTRQVVARFEAERQALALMDHANIAKVHDGGATPSGRPYFVMELVRGVPITDFCDQNQLTPRQRLELFLPVCHAIQHAHQKGVIHRDLKPSNVLVAASDNRPVPKIIDFGVAKAVGQSLTEQSVHTGIGAVVGTLEYMSPEQASFNPLDVDTRSDIYSLGALLYELLTGSPPFNKNDLEKTGMLETLRMIREVEPARPSTRLSMADGLPTVAARRGMEPTKLTRLLRGELDWIVMKALEKDRDRRYETVNGLAMDLGRYLVDEPVQACPPSRWYRFRKFGKRNKAVLGVASAVALAMLVTLAALSTSIVLIRREQAEKQAALDQANARLEQTLDAVDRMLTRVGETRLAGVPYMEKVRRDLLIDALKFCQEFARSNAQDPSMRRALAQAQQRVGLIHELLGEEDRAEDAFHQALAVWQELAVANPARSEYREGVAKCQHNLGMVLAKTGRQADAEAAFQQALAARQALLEEDPGSPRQQLALSNVYSSLGVLRRQQGQLKEAESYSRQALDIRIRLATDHPDEREYLHKLALAKTNLAPVLDMLDQRKESRELLQQAIDLQTQLAAADPLDFNTRDDLAGSYANLGTSHMDNDRLTAEKLLNRAREQYEELVADFPRAPVFRERVVGVLNNLTLLSTGRQRFHDAAEACRQVIAHLARLVKDHPKVLRYRQDLAHRHVQLGSLYHRAKEPSKAIEAYRQAVPLLENVIARAPAQPEHRRKLADCHSNLGGLLENDNRLPDAFKHLEKAKDLLTDLVNEFPTDASHRSGLGGCLNNLARVFLKQKKWTEAQERLEKAVEHQSIALKAEPDNPTFRRFLRNHYLNLADALQGQGKTDEARQAKEAAGRLAERIPPPKK